MDWTAIALSLRLATVVSLVLLFAGVPIAYWLATSTWRGKFLVEAVVSMPLVLSLLGDGRKAWGIWST